jgi:hypothetical protein
MRKTDTAFRAMQARGPTSREAVVALCATTNPGVVIGISKMIAVRRVVVR